MNTAKMKCSEAELGSATFRKVLCFTVMSSLSLAALLAVAAGDAKADPGRGRGRGNGNPYAPYVPAQPVYNPYYPPAPAPYYPPAPAPVVVNPGPFVPPGHGGEIPGHGPGNGHGPPPHAPAYGRRMVTPPARSSDADEVQAARLMADAISNLGCERAGEALRRLSNMLLANAAIASQPEPRGPLPPDLRGRLREQNRRKWRDHFRSPNFWQKVWERMAESYRACDLDCFDDGEAVGQISGAGYCSASVAVGGLNSPGFVYQAPLPLCQNAINQGCQKGYQSAVSAYQGCSAYADGSLYQSIFREYQSQDCHME